MSPCVWESPLLNLHRPPPRQDHPCPDSVFYPPRLVCVGGISLGGAITPSLACVKNLSTVDVEGIQIISPINTRVRRGVRVRPEPRPLHPRHPLLHHPLNLPRPPSVPVQTAPRRWRGCASSDPHWMTEVVPRVSVPSTHVR